MNTDSSFDRLVIPLLAHEEVPHHYLLVFCISYDPPPPNRVTVSDRWRSSHEAFFWIFFRTHLPLGIFFIHFSFSFHALDLLTKPEPWGTCSIKGWVLLQTDLLVMKSKSKFPRNTAEL
uniref:Uncharacterized protein n=2 Tax=Picea TaxID=3328 RepID=A0A101LXQ8_PICGL|nr:hypothetical protein ABT39_MTgene5452 [Picea glauca]QHR91513.1 hypothetical protein Q903MT_gene5548 [Picea sitchensis]